MKIPAILSCLALVSTVGCGPSTPAADSPTTSDLPAKPSPTPEPVAKQNETATPDGGHLPNDEPLVPLKKPASKWQVNGKSLSTVTTSELRDAFVKAGCEAKGDAREGKDLYDRLSFSCQPKGAKGPGDVILVRPSAAPERAKEKAKAPTELDSGDHNLRSSWVYDANADAYLEMSMLDNGKKEQADKLIKAVLKKGN